MKRLRNMLYTARRWGKMLNNCEEVGQYALYLLGSSVIGFILVRRLGNRFYTLKEVGE